LGVFPLLLFPALQGPSRISGPEQTKVRTRKNIIMTLNTGKYPSPNSRESGTTKPTQAPVASATLRTPAKKAKTASSQEEISMKAYEIWLSQGRKQGFDQEHWFQAEMQLSQN
jgi:hypothetical protein